MDDWVPVAQPQPAQTAQPSPDFPVGPNGVTRVQIDVPKTTQAQPPVAAGADDWQPVPGPLTRAAAAVPASQKDQPKDAPKKGSGYARNATAGLNEGIYDTLGAPVDLMTGALNLGIKGINAVHDYVAPPAAGQSHPYIAPITNPVGGSQWIAHGLGKIDPALDPANTVAATPGEKIVRAAGQGASMMIAPEAAVTGLGRAGVLAPEAVAAAAPYVGQSTSAADLAANTVVGAASGTGQGVAQEVAPNSPTAAIVGGLGGGVVGLGLTAIPAVVRAGANSAREFVKPLTQAGQEQMAADRFHAMASDPAAVQQALQNPAPDLVPGSKPTTFQLTGDMGLGAAERSAAATAPDQFAQRTAEQNAARVTAAKGVQQEGAPEQVAAAVRNYRDALDAQTQGAVDAASQQQATAAGQAGSALRDQVTGIGAASQGRLDTATTAAQDATAQVGLGQTPEQAGNVVRGSLEAARADAQARESALWKAVDPQGNLTIQPKNTIQAAADIPAKVSPLASPVGGEEKAIYDAVGQAGDTIPFQHLDDLRQWVGKAMRNEFDAGNMQAYNRLKTLNNAIHDDLQTAVENRVAQDQQAVAAGTMKAEDTFAAEIARQRDAWLADRSARAQQAGGPTGYSGNGASGSASISGTRGATSQTVGRPAGAAGAPGLPPGIGTQQFDQAALDRLTAARAATKERAATYDNKTLAPMLRRPGPSYDFNMPDAAVAAKVFASGKGGFQSVQTYRNAVGDPAALQALRDYAVDRLRNQALRPDGTLDPTKVATFRKQYSDALRAFPDLDKQFADAATASQTMADVAREHAATTNFLSKLQDFALRPDGSVDHARVDKFVRDNHDFVAQNPRLAKSLSDVQSATEAMASAAAQRKAALDDAQKDILGQLMGLHSPESVSATVGGLFSRKDAIEQFTNLRAKIGNNPDAQEGLKKSIADYITQKFVGNSEAGTSGVGAMKSDSFQTFMKQHGATLKAAGFSDQQIATMKAIAADLQRSNRSASAVKLPGSNTAQDSRSILQRIIAASGGKVGGAVEGGAAGHAIGSFFGPIGAAIGAGIGAVGGVAMNSLRQAGLDNVDAMVRDALLNPERAKVLLSKASGPESKENWGRFANMYGRAGVATGVRYYDQHSKQFVPQEHVDGLRAALEAKARAMAPGVGAMH